MAKKAFPQLIHVTREEEKGGDSWLQVYDRHPAEKVQERGSETYG